MLKKILLKQSAYTLVEMLIAISIFSSLLIISSTALSISYTTGRTSSMQKQKINRDMIFISELIRSAMINANTADVGTGIRGFKIITDASNNSIIGIASAGSPNQCTFFGFLNNAIYEFQGNCPSSFPTSVDNTFQRISSSDIKFTQFSVDGPSLVSPPPSGAFTTISRFTLTFAAVDTIGIVTTPYSLKNTYYLSYENIKSMGG